MRAPHKHCLLRQSDPPYQVLEARVAAQWIETGLYFQSDHDIGMLVISLFQPVQRLVFVVHRRVCTDRSSSSPGARTLGVAVLRTKAWKRR
jgi:hypothetical protein